MKLPKGFGGQGFGGMMAKAQEAMARAQNLEVELANERITIDKGPVKAVVAGTGQLVRISLDKSVIELTCPSCKFPNAVTVREVRFGLTIPRRGCKSKDTSGANGRRYGQGEESNRKLH